MSESNEDDGSFGMGMKTGAGAAIGWMGASAIATVVLSVLICCVAPTCLGGSCLGLGALNVSQTISESDVSWEQLAEDAGGPSTAEPEAKPDGANR